MMLLGISLIPVLLMGITSYISSKRVLNNKLETTSSQTTQEVSRGIDNYFSAMSNTVNIITQDTNVISADNPIYFHFAKSFLENVKETDDNIVGVYVGSEKGVYYTYPENKLEKNIDYKGRDWYKAAMEHQGEIVISKPYTSTTTGKRVVSISKTITDGNIITGVAGMNIDLDNYSSGISKIKVGQSGYIFICDTDGLMISHPNSSMIGKDIVTKLSFWDEALKNKDGFTTYEFEGEEKFGAYYTSEVTGWKVMASLSESELTNDTQIIVLTCIVITIIIGLCAIVLSIRFTEPIGKNIQTLLDGMGKIANGDLTASVTIKSKDEFNQLGVHFNEMAGNISKLINEVSISSNTVLDTAVVLAAMSVETNASVNEVARAVEEVSNGATEQARNAVEGANSISDLADKLNVVEESANIIDQLSDNANNLTSQGLIKVQTLIQTSSETKDSTTKISQLINDMKKSMNQINAISDTINGITEQTNLLALNASIEAARAGEAGRGFAVVADEIRNLAEQSKVSTVQIKGILDEIRHKTELSVEAMEITDENVKEQVEIVGQTQAVFRDIMSAVSNLSEKISEIKENTIDIASKKENIVVQIENISAISEESASATEEVTASTEEISVTMDEVTKHADQLRELSSELQEKVNEFKF